MNETSALAVLLFVVLGLGIGSLHFVSLWWSVRSYVRSTSHGWTWLLHIGRVLVTAGAFVWVASNGALPLLSTLAGFLLARPLVARFVTRAA
ncbi:MAG: ATP synthase subunit I [Planctomycetes bacterium]|nr:ATP synthase subunit I [Planctomycetota bacterium]